MIKKSKNDKIKIVTISEYINENQKLISVIGIFGALSAFFINLGEDAKYLAVLSFSIFLLVCWSAWVKIPKNDDTSIPLLLFGILLLLLVLNLVIFYHKRFSSDFLSFLNVVIILLFFWIIFEFKTRHKLFKFFDYIRSRIKNKIIHNSLIFLIIMIISIIIIKLSNWLAKFISFLISRW